jgi:hypothetical protein
VTTPPITAVRLTAASFEQSRTGLVGYLTFRYGRLRVDSVVLRVAADGRPRLTFPARRDRDGREHPFVRPVDQEARQEIERAVFAALGLEDAS